MFLLSHPATPYIYTLSLHDALPISEPLRCFERALALQPKAASALLFKGMVYLDLGECGQALAALDAARADKHSRALCEHLRDRKSTRLNSSHMSISYAVFCLKKKKK